MYLKWVYFAHFQHFLSLKYLCEYQTTSETGYTHSRCMCVHICTSFCGAGSRRKHTQAESISTCISKYRSKDQMGLMVYIYSELNVHNRRTAGYQCKWWMFQTEGEALLKYELKHSAKTKSGLTVSHRLVFNSVTVEPSLSDTPATHDIIDNSESPNCPSIHFNT